MSIGKSRRAGQIGGSRGGCGGGGYERLDPDFEGVRLRRLVDEYLSLEDAHWRQLYLKNLSRADKAAVMRYTDENPAPK